MPNQLTWKDVVLARMEFIGQMIQLHSRVHGNEVPSGEVLDIREQGDQVIIEVEWFRAPRGYQREYVIPEGAKPHRVTCLQHLAFAVQDPSRDHHLVTISPKPRELHL